LDVVAKQRIRDFIRQTNREQGTTIILTTHDLGDVARLCQRVMIIDHGRLLFDGPLDELTTRFGGERELVVDFAEGYQDVNVDGARVVERDGRRVTYRFSRGEVSASELIARISGQYRVRDLSVRDPEIEETVRRIYEERLLDN
jgi:ABC-2 type transport system ATP-binding protein